MSDLKGMNVLVIGSGPTTIGQTGESHEGALEACRSLSELGCRLITIDANPEAVFNGGAWSRLPLIEPLTLQAISKIVSTEKPDALLTLFGGRDGLHLSTNLYQSDTLSMNKCQVWGPSEGCLQSIRNRDTLQNALSPIGLKTPSIFPVDGIDAAVEKAQTLGFPVVLRCDDPQLLPDGLLIYNQDELNHIGTTLSRESSITLSVESSLLEWQQIEVEVLRDRTGKTRIINSIEYLDTAGVHPGDAIGVCPPQSISESLKMLLHTQSEAIATHLSIVGNATMRFAYHPTDQQLLILAVHPRYTASSAFAARISGAPIAKISTLLSAGFSLDDLFTDLPNASATDRQPEVIGVKWPKWDFMRLKNTEDRLGPQMQATGHNIGYGTSFLEAFQKAARATGEPPSSLFSDVGAMGNDPLETILPRVATPTSRRPIEILASLKKGAEIEEIVERSHISPWFIRQFKALVRTEDRLASNQGKIPEDQLLRLAKTEGFSNQDMAHAINLPAEKIEAALSNAGVLKCWKSLPGKDQTLRYSTFGSQTEIKPADDREKIVIIGNGGYGIGNGEECDYGIFHAAQAVEMMGYAAVLINSNITSLTTGLSALYPCYCDPLSLEDIADVIRFEKPLGIMTQFAGTNADKLTMQLSEMGFDLLGPPKETLRLQNDKTLLKKQLRQLGIPQPAFDRAQSVSEATEMAEQMGYPVLVSNCDDTSTELIRDPQTLDVHLGGAGSILNGPIWIEQLLEYAIEAQAEVLCDGKQAHVTAIMEHIELAGVHAGDSAAVLPPYSIAPRHIETITEHCHKIAISLGIKGLVNIRFGIYRDTVYLLETAGNISRNLAMVSKTLNLPLVAWATRLILGDTLADLDIRTQASEKCAVRAPVFPFNAFSKVDPLLGPNMRATGQVMALCDTFGMAYFKAMEATATPLPLSGTVLITVTDEDKSSILEPSRIFRELGFNIMATKGTHKILAEHGIASTQVRKLGFGRPNLVDEIKNGNVQIVINTPTGGQGQIDDSVIRKAAIGSRIVNITTPASAQAAAKGIAAALEQENR